MLIKPRTNATAIPISSRCWSRRAAEVVAVALAAITHDGCPCTRKSTAENGVTWLGSVTRLLHEMNR